MATFTDGYGGDVTTAKDTYIRQDDHPERNHGADTVLLIYPSLMKALFRFDVSSIPSGSTCNSATLKLYQANSGAASAFTLTVYSVASGNGDWAEGTQTDGLAASGESCWNAKAADGAGGVTTAWAGSAGLETSGTDYEASSIGSDTGDRSDANGTEYSFSLTTSRVAGWFGASNTNYGIVVVADGSIGGIASSDHATTAWHPQLIVDYTASSSQGPRSTSYFAMNW